MKITLNLANPPSFRERYGLTLAVPTALAGLLIVALLGLKAGRDYREYGVVQKDLQLQQVRQIQVADQLKELQGAFRQPKTQGMLREAQFVNTLINRKRLSLAELTLKLAELLPPEVRLSSLTLLRSDTDSDLRFQVSGKSAEALEEFLKNLVDDPDFQDSSVASEGFEKEGPGAGEVTIVCQTRYVGVQNDETEKKGSE